MSMPRCLVMLGVLLLGVACAPGSQATPKSSPVSQAGSTPSEQPSPTPSPSAPDLKITSAAFHAGEIGFGYAPAGPTATGGVPPYTWSIAGGALPTGLGMDSSGAVTGTPGALGTFLFTVQVNDSGGNTASIDTTINVVQRLAVSPACPTNFPCMVEAGCVTACGGFGNQSGGMPPYSYRVVGGAIPSGMGLNGLTLAGTFPAPPAGSTTDWLFTVRVTDGLGATSQTTAKFHVFPHITFTLPIPACTGATVGTGCTATLHYTGGTPGLTIPPFKTTPSPLPSGWKVAPNNGTVTVTIPPTCPKSGQPFTATLTIVLVDGSICASGGGYCSSAPAVVKITLLC
jgi:putative Ig domain-containing protein